jgi:uncharacterized protein (TIGR02996 family)
MPRYEFVEGSSSKFWEIELDGVSFTARWGRIGTEGQEKTQTFASPAEAKKEYEKLISSKVKKGYQAVEGGGDDDDGEAGQSMSAASNPELEAAIEKNLDDPQPWLVYADWLQSQGDPRGEFITLSHQGKHGDWLERHTEALFGEALAEKLDSDPPELDLEWRLGFVKAATIKRADYDSDTDVDELTQTFLARPVARFIRALTFGLTGYESDNDYTGVVEAIVASGRGKTLQSLWFGEFDYPDETEISWAPWGALGPLWKAVPNLKSFGVRGAGGSFGSIDLPNLVSFTVETGGLAQDALKSIVEAKWPKLERLEVWTGDTNYGAESTAEDWLPLLEARAAPKLTHLAVRNSEYTDALVGLLVSSKLLPQLTSLDLSMGTLGEVGAQLILDNAKAFAHLTELNVSESFVPVTMFEALRKVCAKVDVTEQREPSDYREETGGRYVAVGE